MHRRRARWMALAVVALLGGGAASNIGFGDASLYPATGSDAVAIYLVSNGFHSGLVLPRPETHAAAYRAGLPAALTVTTRFASYDWIEAGWGEDRFYRTTPTLGSIDWRLALRALFWPGNETVVHIVGIAGDPRPPFAGADLVKISLSRQGFERLVGGLDRSFARDANGQPTDLGAGLYGPSLFYRAVGTFSFANVCNHWTARELGLAGVPVWPLVATLPRGLVLDLMLRSGLSSEPDALPVSAATQ